MAAGFYRRVGRSRRHAQRPPGNSEIGFAVPTTVTAPTSPNAPVVPVRGPFSPWLVCLPLAKLAIHLSTLTGYGWFRDELYYLACARHLDWGYVDHPALSILLLRLWTAVFGEGREAVRVLPALVGAATVLVVGLIARRLGGRATAQAVAMLAALLAPVYLGTNHVYSMNSWDLLYWALAALFLTGVIVDTEPWTPPPGWTFPTPGLRAWVGLGLVLTLGLANKISLLWFGAGLAVALVATPVRRTLRTRWPWLVGTVAVLGGLGPYALWNAAHGWPTREFMHNATSQKMAAVSLGAFVKSQVEMLDPLTAPLWIAGLLWLWFGAGGRFRALAIIYLVVAAILVGSGTSRAGYLAPAYTWLFAAGGVAFEIGLTRLDARARSRGWVGGRLVAGSVLAVAALLLIASGVALTPFALPVLPVERFVAYQHALGVEPGTEEKKAIGPLPQHYADMHGWDTIVDGYARAWHTLTPDEQRVAALYAPDYGVAGAIDLLGPARGLPPAISGHNNYFLWGPHGATGDVVIVQDDDPESLARQFADVQLIGPVVCGLCMPYEREASIYVCRRPKVPIGEIWPRVRNFS